MRLEPARADEPRQVAVRRARRGSGRPAAAASARTTCACAQAHDSRRSGSSPTGTSSLRQRRVARRGRSVASRSRRTTTRHSHGRSRPFGPAAAGVNSHGKSGASNSIAARWLGSKSAVFGQRLGADDRARVDPEHVAGAVEPQRHVDGRPSLTMQADRQAGQRLARPARSSTARQRVGVVVGVRRARAHPGQEAVAAHAGPRREGRDDLQRRASAGCAARCRSSACCTAACDCPSSPPIVDRAEVVDARDGEALLADANPGPGAAKRPAPPSRSRQRAAGAEADRERQTSIPSVLGWACRTTLPSASTTISSKSISETAALRRRRRAPRRQRHARGHRLERRPCELLVVASARGSPRPRTAR